MLQKKLETQATRQKKRRSKISIALAAVFVLCAAGAAAFYYFGLSRSDAPAESTVEVTSGSIDLTVGASGTIRPRQEVKISPKVTGLVKKLNVEQGDKVKKGEVIAAMDDSNIVGQVEAARSALKLAEAAYDKAVNGNRPQEIAEAEAMVERARDGVRFSNLALNRAKAQVESKKAELVRDRTNAQRMTMLATQGAVSDQDRLNAITTKNVASIALDQAQQELRQAAAGKEQAESDLEQAVQRLSLLKAGTREEDVRAAKHSVAQARGNLRFLESQLNDCKIRAPFDGVISQKYADEGAIVTPTTASATTSATSSSIVSLAGALEMVALVSETDVGHLKLGQKTRIVANAYPTEQFYGRVTLIAPAAVVTQNVTTFEVHSSIDDDRNEKLMSGMNVHAEFLAGSKDDVLLIPAVCVISEKGKTGVYVPGADGKPEFRPIKIGRTDGNKTRILKGLEKGERVFLALSEKELKKHGYQDTSWRRGKRRVNRRMGMPRHHK